MLTQLQGIKDILRDVAGKFKEIDQKFKDTDLNFKDNVFDNIDVKIEKEFEVFETQ